MNSIKMTNKDEMKRGRDAGMVGAPNLSRNHRRRVKNTLSFIFVMIYLAFLFINSQSPSFFKGGLSAIFAEAGESIFLDGTTRVTDKGLVFCCCSCNSLLTLDPFDVSRVSVFLSFQSLIWK
jgi:hypothetical protein